MTKRHYTVAGAKAHLDKLVERVARGEEVVIVDDGKPIAKLIPFIQVRRRLPGTAKGGIVMAPDFDETPSDFDPYL
jgi:prevent-host-death family protein